MKLICPDCGTQYDSGKFCQECGAKLQEVAPELVCPSCGYIAKSGKFCPECGTKLTEQIPTQSNSAPAETPRHNITPKKMTKTSCLPMDEIIKASNASYPKQSLKNIAVATLKIAEVIQERLSDRDVSYMVYPYDCDDSVSQNATPIQFLFKKNGVPKVAVVAVTESGYECYSVLETKSWCEDHSIEYVRVYADGTYADWITGWSKIHNAPVTPQAVEFCKNWLVEKITKHL